MTDDTKRFHAMWDDYLGWNGRTQERREKSKLWNRLNKKKSGGRQVNTMAPIEVGRNEK